MKSHNSLAPIAFAVALAIGSISTQSANAEIQTSVQSVTKIAALTDWSEAFTFATFNSELGTLLSVQVTVSTSATTTITVENTGTSASTGSVRTNLQLTVSDPAGLFALDPNTTYPQIDINVPNAAPSYDLSSGQSVVLGAYTRNSGNITSLYDSSAILSQFTGNSSDTINITLATLAQTLLANSGGNTSASQITTATGNLTITYTYDAVPEPSTYALVGLGLAAVLVFRRRLKAGA